MDRKSKVIIVGIVSAIVLMMGLFLYSLFFLNRSEPGLENNEDNAKLDEVIPKDLSEYNFSYYDYDRLYNYYFKMQDVKEKIVIDTGFNSIKIENNKLLWNVDGNWIQDRKIVDDIEYLIMDFSVSSGEDKIVISTNTNKLYVINFHNVDIYDSENENNTYLDLTNDMFEKIIYTEIELIDKVSKINLKEFYECEGWSVYYLEINGSIYVLDYINSKVVELSEYLNKYQYKFINDFDNNCMIKSNDDLVINFDSTLENIKNSNNQDIYVKHYIHLNNDNSSYHIIIDKNDYLYFISEQDIILKKAINYGKVIDFNYQKSANNRSSRVKISLSTGELVELVNSY